MGASATGLSASGASDSVAAAGETAGAQGLSFTKSGAGTRSQSSRRQQMIGAIAPMYA